MLLVTYEIGFADHVANRVLFIAEGGIYEDGMPDEVLNDARRPLTKNVLNERKRSHF